TWRPCAGQSSATTASLPGLSGRWLVRSPDLLPRAVPLDRGRPAGGAPGRGPAYARPQSDARDSLEHLAARAARVVGPGRPALGARPDWRAAGGRWSLARQLLDLQCPGGLPQPGGVVPLAGVGVHARRGARVRGGSPHPGADLRRARRTGWGRRLPQPVPLESFLDPVG